MKKFISILISAVMVASIFTSLPVNTFAAKKKAQRVSLKKKSVTIKIIESEKNIAYGKTSVKIKKAKGVTIKKITYKSTNKKIAKVNKKGVVTAVKKGTAKIKAIVKYKFKKRNYTKKLTLKVKVKHEKGLIGEPASEAPESTTEVVTEPFETTAPEKPEESTPAVTDPAATGGDYPTGVIAPTGNDVVYPTYSQDDTGHCTDQDKQGVTDPDWTGVTKPDGSPYYEYYETTPESEPIYTTSSAEKETTQPATTPHTFEQKLTAFSNKLYNMASLSENDNYVMSPISVYMALAMLYEVGDDGVKQDIKALTEMDDSDIQKTGELFKSLVNEYRVYDYENNEEIIQSKLSLSNSIWLDNNLKTSSEGLKAFADKLYGEAHATTFRDDNDAANAEIQEFIKEQTKGLIDQNFNLSPETIFALINTLYFKDVWDGEGDWLYTEQREFTLADGTSQKREFLNGKYVLGQVQQTDKSNYFFVKTAKGYKIKFVLPKDGYTLKEAMSADNLNKINNDTEFNQYENGVTHYTRCIFPSFKIESGTALAEIFKKNGKLKNAFSSFTSSVLEDKEELCVSKIIHKAVLDVAKEGIEGAAVTIIAVEDACTDPVPVPEEYHNFILDKNFGFLVTDYKDTVLFEGQVTG